MNGVFHLGNGVDLDPLPDPPPPPDDDGNKLRFVVGEMTPLMPLGGVMLL